MEGKLANVGNNTMDALQEGAKIGGSRKAVETMVALLRTALGANYPAFLGTPAGKRLEPYLASIAVMGIAGLLGDKMPALKTLETVAKRAITGFSANDLADLLGLLEPLAHGMAELATTEQGK